MKTRLTQYQARLLCAAALGMGTSLNFAATFSDANWISMGGIPGANGAVSAAVVDGSGNLYIGGDFTVVGEVIANNIAKWDGSSWSPLGSGMGGGGVSALAVSGSDLYAGGQFTTAGGIAATNIAKWNGSSWSALGSGMGGSDPYNGPFVSALAVSGSDLYVGGRFTMAGGSAVTNIAKWDGRTWSALGSGLVGADVLYPVRALAAAGSDLYAGGYFTTAGGSAANNIAKWNGSSWSALGSGIGGVVNALAVSGSDLYAGGAFSMAGGSPATNIAKWNGSSWSALGSGISDSPYIGPGGPSVAALAVLGGNVYAGGQFTTAGGSAANCIAKWDGSSWSALGSGMVGVPPYYDYPPAVYALAASGSDLYAGGYFTNAGGIPANFIAKWDGSSWSALSSGVDWTVVALAVSGSNVYAGGLFYTVGGSNANYIAKWDGSSWSALGSGMNDTVNALAVSGSDMYVGGNFTTAGGKVSAYLARAIVNPPVLVIEGDGDGGCLIRFSGVPGSDYQLQRAPGLSGPWATSSPQTAPASGHLEFWDIFPPPDQGFYRSVGP